MSNIEWTQETWNPIAGCSKVSAGCTYCYAETMAGRLEAMGQEKYKGLTVLQGSHRVWSGKIAFDEHALLEPLRRKKPTTYFVNSMSDLFHENVTDEQIDRVFAVMALCPQHTFQVLTKRPERMRDYCHTLGRHHTVDRVSIQMKQLEKERGASYRLVDGGWAFPNVWLGVSVENQKAADERIPLLLQTPAAVRFISAEPLLEPLNLEHIEMRERIVADLLRWHMKEGRTGIDPANYPSSIWLNALTGATASGDKAPALDWVIVGGESGHGSRLCNVEWIRSIVQQCAAAGVPCFVKQMGSRPIDRIIRCTEYPVGVGIWTDEIGGSWSVPHLKDRKGGNPAEWPEDLRVRQMPNKFVLP